MFIAKHLKITTNKNFIIGLYNRLILKTISCMNVEIYYEISASNNMVYVYFVFNATVLINSCIINVDNLLMCNVIQILKSEIQRENVGK